jgi:hypothetical protein
MMEDKRRYLRDERLIEPLNGDRPERSTGLSAGRPGPPPEPELAERMRR